MFLTCSTVRSNDHRVFSCTLFCAIQISDRPFHASFSGIHNPDPGRHFDFDNFPSGSSCSSDSSGGSLKRQTLKHTRSNEVEYYSQVQPHWLQGHQGQSFQAAVYPPSLKYSVHRPLSPHRLYRTPGGNLRPTSPHSQFGRAPYTPSPPARTPFSIFTAGRAIAPLPRKSPLSHVRQVSEPEVPAIPDKFRVVKLDLGLKRQSALSNTWSPTLLHPPLSADPAIQAFSIDIDGLENSRRSRGIGFARRLSNALGRRLSDSKSRASAPSDTIRLVEPNVDGDFKLQDPPKPNVPSRSKGRSAKPRISRSSLPSPSVFQPAGQLLLDPADEALIISQIPPYPPSDLCIPRSRPHSVAISNGCTNVPTLTSIDRSYDAFRKESLEESVCQSIAMPPPVPLQSPRRKLSKCPPSQSHSHSHSRSTSFSSQTQPATVRSFSHLHPPQPPTAASSVYSSPVSSRSISRAPSTHSSLRPTPPLPHISFPRISHEADADLEVLRVSRRFSGTPPLSPPQKMGTTTTISATNTFVGSKGGGGAASAVGRGEVDGGSIYWAYAFACSPLVSAAPSEEARQEVEVERGRAPRRGHQRKTSTTDDNGVRTHRLTRVRSRDGRLVKSEIRDARGHRNVD